MTTDKKIKAEKLQNDLNKEAAKILTLSSANIEKHKYLTGK